MLATNTNALERLKVAHWEDKELGIWDGEETERRSWKMKAASGEPWLSHSRSLSILEVWVITEHIKKEETPIKTGIFNNHFGSWWERVWRKDDALEVDHNLSKGKGEMTRTIYFVLSPTSL